MDSSHATRTCVFILLVALLCAERAQGLECYCCLGVPLETSCKSMTCPYSDGFCVTQEEEVIVDSHTIKVKSNLCLPICPTNPENTEFLGTAVNVKTSCCKEDLCNAAVLTEGSTWTMAGVILFSLGSVHLQTLL
ncbi:lymphocyte antigen 6A-2/6E-1-like [Mus caroli]|uniref:Lymphocyte antigen 6A-2/6E-1-like n=1 Tax=Mus caroli TaxID=10089 RepID=A0A6P5QWT9_MUSCR|nr:lymphocyte antigen 6A-2/6E-1-like [Mus caroli]XP_021039139.1 lymphocyte antigen 6A-2/6E-1-like [Mus caroli]